MSVLEKLTDEECYLWALLSDPSGLDQAEFLWVDAEHTEPSAVDDDGNPFLDEDGNPTVKERNTYCFRAWPYQWAWWRCEDVKQIDACGRSVGKSLSIKVRGFAFAFLKPGQEMLLTAPEGVHLDAITDLIETQILSTRLSREMLTASRSKIKHRPFHVNFQNGARIMGRIPQRDGKGVKGQHPVWLELDEAQDYPDKGWIEISETLKRGSNGIWRSHGVTRGLRDYFYKYTQPDSGWTVHRFTAMHRPTWTDEERQAAIKQYGSKENPDYRRNILGLHGDATNPLFVLHRLAKCFPGDTKVLTPDGYKLIKDLKVDDEVLNALGSGTITDINISDVDEICEVILSDGQIVHCTPEHPFFTERGWVHADKLESNERIFTRDEILRMVQSGNNNEEKQKVLLEKLYADLVG